MRSFRTAGAAALALMLTACAATSEQPTTAKAQTGRQCLFARNISSFKAVDQDTVNFRANVNEFYQAELFAPCNDIQFSEGIGLRTRSGGDTICSPLDAELLVRGPSGTQRCALTSFHKLTPAEVAALAPRDRP